MTARLSTEWLIERMEAAIKSFGGDGYLSEVDQVVSIRWLAEQLYAELDNLACQKEAIKVAKVKLPNDTPTDWVAVKKAYGWGVYHSEKAPFPIAVVGTLGRTTVGKTGDEGMIANLMAGAITMLEELKLIEAGWAIREARGVDVGFTPLTTWESKRLAALRRLIAESETEGSE